MALLSQLVLWVTLKATLVQFALTQPANIPEWDKNCDPSKIQDCVGCGFDSANTPVCLMCNTGTYMDFSTFSCIKDAKCNNCNYCSLSPLDGVTVECSSCSTGTFKSTTTGNCELCPIETSYNETASACQNCGNNCLGCYFYSEFYKSNSTDPNTNEPLGETVFQQNCRMCKSGYSIDYFSQDHENCVYDPQAISNCEYGCKTCSWQGSNKCSECLEGFVMGSYGMCQVSCPANCQQYSCYMDTTINKPYCFSCEAGFSTALDGSCIKQAVCSRGSFSDPSSGTSVCSPCPLNCESCFWYPYDKKPYCNYCKEGLYVDLYTAKCVQQLNKTDPDCGLRLGKVLSPAGTDPVCDQCNDYSCTDCYSDISICKECDRGFVLDTLVGQCQWDSSTTNGNSCKAGYFYNNQTSSCDYCPYGCKSCFGEPSNFTDYKNYTYMVTTCTECEKIGFYNDNGYCVSTACWPGAVFDNGACQQCPKNCESCSNSGSGLECSSCYQGFDFNKEKKTCEFSGSCPTPQVVWGNTFTGQFCTYCPFGCTDCKFNSNSFGFDCTACESTLTLNSQNNKCEQECESGLYYNIWNLNCEQCPQGSTQCFFDDMRYSVNATVCETGFQLNLALQICTSETPGSCGAGFYADPYTQECLECMNGCTQCENIEQFGYFQLVCTQCQDGFINGKSYCYPDWNLAENCTSGNYFNFEERKCTACSTSGDCLDCFYNSWETTKSTYCYNCDPQFFNVNGECKKLCDQKYYGQIDKAAGSWECVQCSENCDFCDYSYETGSDVCLVCSSGYFKGANGKCQKIKYCTNPDEFRMIEYDFETNQMAESECYSCPSECHDCYLVDPLNFYGGFNCGSCANGYIKDEYGACINKLESQKLFCQEGEYNKPTGSETSPWACQKCKSDCAYCDGFQGEDGTFNEFCFQCASGFFMNWDTYQCQKLIECPVGKVGFIEGEKQSCRDCVQASCQKCSTQDPTDQMWDTCEQCLDGFQLEYGVCFKPYTSDSELSSSCGAGNFGVVFENMGFCAPCPEGAVTCFLADPKNLDNPVLQIDSCLQGYTLTTDQGWCDPTCLPGEYFKISPANTNTNTQTGDATNDATVINNCFACINNCQVCTGPTSAECSYCLEGFQFDQDKNCIEIITEYPECPVGSSFIFDLNLCVCDNNTEVLDLEKGECVAVKEILKDCAIGEFPNTTGGCGKCNSVNFEGQESKSLCAICSGPEPTDCNSCIDGYWLNEEKQCVPCTDRCAKCHGDQICDVCEKGYFKTFEIQDDNTVKFKCSNKCAPGQIMYVPSFYNNNEDIVPADVIRSYRMRSSGSTNSSNAEENEIDATKFYPTGFNGTGGSTTTSATSDNATPVKAQYAIATDDIIVVLDGDEKQLPWQTVKGFPTYSGAQVTIDCIPCERNCSSCTDGSVLLSDTNECYWSTNCPEQYVPDLQLPNVCHRVAEGAFSVVLSVLSETQPNVHRIQQQKDLIVAAFSQAEDLTCLWRLEKIINSRSGQDVGAGARAGLIGDNNTDCLYVIPFEKLRMSNIVTTFCVNATSKGQTIRSCIDVSLKGYKEILDLSSINVDPSEFKINRDSGLSAGDQFIVSGDFSQSLEKRATIDTFFTFRTRVFLKREEKVEDQDQTFFVFNEVSSDLGYSFQYSFITVPFDNDEELTVENCISDFSDQLYCTQSQITALQNTQFDIFTSDICNSPTTDPSVTAFCVEANNQAQQAATKQILRRSNRRTLQETLDKSKQMALQFYNQLANLTLTPASIATFITTLRKTITTYVDATIYPSVKSLILQSVPYINSQSLISEIDVIIDTLALNQTIITPKQGKLLKKIADACFYRLVREQIDFGTRYIDNDSQNIKQIGFLVDKKDPASKASEKNDFRKIWNDTNIPAPTVELTRGFFEEQQIVSISYSTLSLEKYNQSITSKHVVNLYLYDKAFEGQSSFNFSQVQAEKFKTEQFCFDISRDQNAGGDCSWYNYDALAWNQTGCKQNSLVAQGQQEVLNCCCSPHQTFALSKTDSVSYLIYFQVLSIFIILLF